jgi:hypothetical protein
VLFPFTRTLRTLTYVHLSELMKSIQLLVLMSTLATAALAADSKVGFVPADTVATVLNRQAGKLVELRLKSGDKIAGKVEAVGDKTVHLGQLVGQEFYDAVVVIDDISAVVIRTAGK